MGKNTVNRPPDMQTAVSKNAGWLMLPPWTNGSAGTAPGLSIPHRQVVGPCSIWAVTAWTPCAG